MALRYADYGYILENGRIVMDGEAQGAARERGRQGVLPRRRRRRAQELPRREVLQAPQALAGVKHDAPSMRHRKRWKRAMTTSTTTARDPRPRQRELAQFALLPDLVRQAMQGAGLGRASRRASTPPRSPRARRWPAAGAAQVGARRTCRPQRRPFGGFATSPAGALARVFMSPGPIFEPEGSARTGGARRARCSPPASARRHRAQLLRLSPHAGRLDARCGRARARLRRDRRRPRQTEQQLEAIQHLQADGLRRHAGLPEDPAREGARRRGSDASSLQARRWSAAERSSPRCGPSTSSAASTPTRSTPPPTSASSPTRARRSRA